MKEKVNDLVRLHKAMQEKLNKHHIQSKSKYLPWYLIKGLECTVQNILKFLNTLFQLHIKSKKVGGILAKPAPKKGKTITTSSGNKHL